MLDNREIIDKFSEEQKLKLVTGFAGLADEKINALGVPRVVFSTLDELNVKFGSPYPSFSGMAASWNVPLFTAVAADLCYRAAAEVNAVYTPPANVRTSAYASGLAEDPFLVKAMIKGMCGGISRVGLSSFVPDCSVRQIDAKYMDKAPDYRAISELLLRTYTDISAKSVCSGICRAPKALKKKYSGVNGETADRLLSDRASDVKIVYMNAPQDIAVSTMTKSDELVSDTSAGALKAALLNYRRIKADVDRGAVSLEELNKAVADGVAISDEMLDAAVDKVVNFAADCAVKCMLETKVYSSAVSDEYAQADYEVRLKQKRSYFASQQMATCGDLDKYRKNLAMLAARESIVLLKNTGVLPLSRGKKIAVVGEAVRSVPEFLDVVKDYLVHAGMTYLGYADGYKSDGAENALTDRALNLAAEADVTIMFLGHGVHKENMLGEENRLALPADQLALLDKIVKHGGTVVAVAVGDFLPDVRYDRHCAASLFMPYGGSYSATALINILTGVNAPVGKLAFSGYNDVDAHFKTLRDLKNAGRNKVGVFLGYRHYITSGLPARYPFGYGLSYAKFEYSKLKRVNGGFNITVKNTSKHDGSEIVQLYVQKKSETIVRPTRELKGFVKIALKAREKKQVLIPFDESDLAVYDVTRGAFAVESGAYKIAVGASSTDIRLATDITVDGVSIEGGGDKLSDYIGTLSNVVSDGFTLTADVGKKQKFVPHTVADFPYEKLFLDEFGMEAEDDDEIDDEIIEDDDDDDITKYIGMGVSPDMLVAGLKEYMSAQGIAVKDGFLRDMIAGLYTSRLIFVCCDDLALFTDFASALGGFLSTNPVFVSAAGYTTPDDMFVESDGTPTVISRLLATSKQEHSRFKLIAGTDFDPADMNGYFTPFIRYIANPENGRITYGDYGDADKTFDVAQNLWFMVNVTPEAAAAVPAHIADISALVMLNGERCAGAPVRNGLELNCYKFFNAFEKHEKLEIREEYWKMIDRLCSYAASKCGAHISNKMWIQMEKFIASYMSMGGEESAAADAVTAVKLVPLLAPMLKNILTKDDGSLAQIIGGIFGEDASAESMTVAKRLGIRPRVV